MKNLKLILALAIVELVAFSCGPKKTGQNVEEEKVAPKILVLYYSQTGNTKAVATEVTTRLGADIDEIVPVQLYDGDFQATIERGRKVLEEGASPKFNPSKLMLPATRWFSSVILYGLVLMLHLSSHSWLRSRHPYCVCWRSDWGLETINVSSAEGLSFLDDSFFRNPRNRGLVHLKNTHQRGFHR